jgi:hypothetical protein
MSQLRAISSGIRSAIAVVAVWGLMLGVAASGAAAANAANPSSETSASGGLFACFKRHMTHQTDVAGEKTPERQSKKHHCPDCCLAAHAAAAVLPARLATIARPSQAPQPIAYLAATSREPESFSSRTVNGARAPPHSL